MRVRVRVRVWVRVRVRVSGCGAVVVLSFSSFSSSSSTTSSVPGIMAVLDTQNMLIGAAGKHGACTPHPPLPHLAETQFASVKQARANAFAKTRTETNAKGSTEA